MSVIGGQNIPVTNGLVYALDFKNNKCYISGSNILKSIYYDPVATIVTGSFTASAGNTNLSISSPTYRFSVYSENDFYIQRTGSTFNFDQNSTFTISTVLNVQIPGAFLFQNTTNSKFAAQVSTSSLDIGFYNPLTENYYTRRFPVNLQTGSVHLVYRYDNGTSDVFLNGIPVTSSQTNVVPTALSVTSYRSNIKFNSISSSLYTGYLGIRGTAPYEPTSIVTPYSGSISSFAVYSRVLTSTEIYSLYVQSNPTLFPGAYNKPYSLDENALMYISASGITSSTYITAIDNFVTGLKSAGLWNKLSAVYPTVGSTTSSQALNLKEPGVNRLTYSGSWTASTLGAYPSSSTSYLQLAGFDYPTIATSSAHITYLSYDLPQVTASLVAVDKSLAATGGEIFYSGSRTYHVFKPTGTSSFTVLSPALTAVEVLAVGGGGAGGLAGYSAGGGGAGGLVYSSSFIVSPQTYTVVVGEGGYPGLNGLNTTFSTITAYGGGAGNSGNGGSGGGAGSTFNTTGSGGTASYAGQGNNGGDSLAIYVHGAGGGGGAGTPGQIAGAVPSRGGAGGSGSYFGQYAGLNLGSPVGWFAGGGGGCNSFANSGISGAGLGGIGGGARALIGTDYDSTYQVVAGYGPGAGNGAPTASKNTGGGGGGGSYNNGVAGCGAGGSGIVIISYSSSQAAFTSSFGLSVSGSNIVGNLHSTTTSGITGGGIVGLVTVSRTGSTSISLHQDVTSSIISAPVTASILGSVYGNASNYAGVPSKFGTTTLSYLSYGAGLAPSEVSSYHTLVSKLQYDLGRGLLIQGYPAAAAYSVRQLSKTARYAMTVRRDSDNLTFDVGFDSNGNLNTGSLLTNMTASGITTTLPGDYSGLAAAYSLRRVSSSYTGSSIDVRRDWDNATGSIGFDSFGNLNTSSLLSFVGYENLVLYSQDLTNGYWVKDPGITITADTASAPDGTLTADKASGFTDGNRAIYKDSIPVPSGVTHTFSFYLKAIPGDEGKTVSTTNGLRTLSSEWVRYSASYSNNFNYEWGCKSGATATQYLLWGIQLNSGSSATLYTQTTSNTASAATGLKSGYVAQWYDQSGNNRHVFQTTSSRQPLIVSSGSIMTENEKPTINHIATQDLKLDTALDLGTTYSMLGVIRFNAYSREFIGNFGWSYALLNYPSTIDTEARRAVAHINDVYGLDFSLFQHYRNGTTTINLYKNTSLLGGNTASLSANSNFDFKSLSGEEVDGYNFIGNMSEVLIYTSSQATNRNLITDNINGYYNIFTQSLASSSGYVTQWYDQSGNGKHATQISSSKQPLILRSGSILLENGKPAIYFLGTSTATQQGFNVGSVISTPSDYNVFYVKNQKQGGNNPWLILFGSSYLSIYNFGVTYFWSDGIGNYIGGTTTTPQQQHVGEIYLNSTTNSDSRAYENNILKNQGFTAGSYYKVAIPNLQISSWDSGTYSGSAQEIIISTNNYLPSRSVILSNINSYYNIY